MKENGNKEQIFQSSHMLVLISYTLLAGGLIAESILMGWEFWALPIIAACVVISWILHITETFTGRQRLWTYTLMMMGTFFFYGSHLTSMYDMALLMMIVIIVFTTTGDRALINICLGTYYITMAYDIVGMIRIGTEWDSLLISRTALHVLLMFMAGKLASVIIKQWGDLFQDAEKRIEALNKATNRMNRFLANLSHELRTPINAVMGIASILRDKEGPGEDSDSLDEIINAGYRIEQQTSDILDYSELETGNLIVNNENYGISSLLSDLVSRIRYLIPPSLELLIDVDANVPAVMVSDSEKLKKILYHLISNGLKYTKEGGVYVHIFCRKQAYGVNLCIEVTDTGVGMSKEDAENIFDNRFYHAESGGAVRAGGLGLGLSIVSGFVKALGGFMTVDSEPNNGTTVAVSLPQKVVDEEKCMVIEQPEKISVAGFLNTDKFDNPDIREYYNLMLMHFFQGLKMPMHRVYNLEDLKRLTSQIKMTHLILGEEEYKLDPTFIEALAPQVSVIVVARNDFALPENSRAIKLAKPLYYVPVLNLLNTEKQTAMQEIMICPGVRTLVVDDEPINLRVTSGILQRYGMRVTTVQSGKEALRMCEMNDYDLIFMDHMMPDMDGVETMKNLRRGVEGRTFEGPIVALTANLLSTAKEMFIAEGFDGFVSKPIEISELERILKQVLPEDRIRYQIQEIPAQSVEKQEIVSLEAGGIDSQTGLYYCQNDSSFYKTLLLQFAGDAAEKTEKMDTCFLSGDFENYVIQVHALKSSAKTIGAEKLSENAKQLEAAAKERDASLIVDLHQQMIAQYRAAADVIMSVYQSEMNPQTRNQPTEQTNEDVLEFLPQEEW